MLTSIYHSDVTVFQIYERFTGMNRAGSQGVRISEGLQYRLYSIGYVYAMGTTHMSHHLVDYSYTNIIYEVDLKGGGAK